MSGKLRVWLVLLAGVAGCGKPDASERFQRPETIMNFQSLYQKNCRGCHGPDGKMGPAPPLNDPLFLAIVPDTELGEVIRHGRKGTLMPGFAGRQGDPLARLEKGPIVGSGMLTNPQIDMLIKGMRERWGGNREAGLPRYLSPKELMDDLRQADLDHGKNVFARACACCHGEQGSGGRGSAGAINQPAFLALVSDQLLRRIIITGRPDLGMPDFRTGGDRRTRSGGPEFQPLTEKDIRDVTAVLASWRH